MSRTLGNPYFDPMADAADELAEHVADAARAHAYVAIYEPATRFGVREVVGVGETRAAAMAAARDHGRMNADDVDVISYDAGYFGYGAPFAAAVAECERLARFGAAARTAF